MAGLSDLIKLMQTSSQTGAKSTKPQTKAGLAYDSVTGRWMPVDEVKHYLPEYDFPQSPNEPMENPRDYLGNLNRQAPETYGEVLLERIRIQNRQKKRQQYKQRMQTTPIRNVKPKQKKKRKLDKPGVTGFGVGGYA